MITPVHRFQTVDCRNVGRPNVHRPNVHRSNHHQGKQTISSLTCFTTFSQYANVFFLYAWCLISAKIKEHHHTSRAHHEIHTHAEVNTSYVEPADYSVIQQ